MRYIGYGLTFLMDGHRSAKPLRESLDVLGSVLYRHAMADTTNITYSVHWRQWTSFSRYMKWSKWLSNNPQDNSNKLGLFAIFCWRYGWSSRRVGNQYATIRLKVSSIRWFHRRFAGTELEVSPDFNILMRGIRKLSDPPRKKQPITPAFLRLLYRRLDFTRPRNRLLWGSVLLAYFFLLRRSEFLLVGSMRHSYCLKASNAYFSDDRGVPVPVKIANAVTIGLSDAKNDQFGRGAWRTMHATGDSVLCPLQALTHVLRARSELGHARATHLCVDLTANEVSTSFKALATDVGAPRGHYSTHSVRIGGATALVRGKADSLSIKLIGRWMSNCYESYPVLSAEATQGLSARMI
ncbi:LOW QUALITY PROTEIN: Hypothetical protein PHPALM_17293 [Phytophthora palmivora]|uniref:Tyr recombinase domain-containing protein n=1 Tax=Phytophthora palmivora TaxID=4796 RepID=A0A2P4XMQ7_9STRA|nr:LOW QUALITY PROTEIN: Hypothetical protein PHPALM_17293 [Phytophthora palmivora]